MSPIVRKGWTIYYHPLFAEDLNDLFNKVSRLKDKLSEPAFNCHADTKLFKALLLGIEEKIPDNPLAYYFALQAPLNRYCRLKKMGLPERYRLFFKVYKDRNTIVILWLGFPRREGDKKDCYEVFKRKVAKNEFPEDVDTLIAECEQ